MAIAKSKIDYRLTVEDSNSPGDYLPATLWTELIRVQALVASGSD
jgi:hypothetical protein